MPTHLQTFLVLSLAAACVLAAPAPSATCPTRDDAGSALIEATPSSNGQFLGCEYQAARLCTYFSDGSFSSGSSVCPDSATAAISSGGSSSSGSNNDASIESTSSSGLAQCAPTDTLGGALQGTGVLTSDGFVACTYPNARNCAYFSPGGQFSSGSSSCPPSISPASSSSSSSSSAADPTDGNNTGSNNGASAGSPSSSDLAQCAPADDLGGALQGTGVLTSDGFVACTYPNARNCAYFTPGGQFSSGSSTCPDSITPAGSSGANDGSTGSAPSTPLAQCAATDDAGSALQNSTTTNDGFIACDYQAAGRCEYFTGGQFSAGSSTCPNSITPASSSGANDGLTGAAPSSDLAQCTAADDAGSALKSSTISSDGFVACEYEAAGHCEYFTPTGDFSSGSSTCPDSITQASSISASGAVGVGSFLADGDSDDSGSSHGSTTSSIPKPAVIALLAMNAVLVIGVLVLGTLWVRDRRENTKSRQLKGLYASLDPSRDTAPLTHGTTQGPYYDPHDVKPKSQFDA
ncbi:hypothetical protein DFH09DRAFT_1497995 [Mycena vulgaris]|nr:hypothetical protein DFH09DRAFT_1497995 [Mycena vulgaris]